MRFTQIGLHGARKFLRDDTLSYLENTIISEIVIRKYNKFKIELEYEKYILDNEYSKLRREYRTFNESIGKKVTEAFLDESVLLDIRYNNLVYAHSNKKQIVGDWEALKETFLIKAKLI